MKIEEAKVGDRFELDATDSKGNAIVINFEIIEKSWYESKTKKGVLFHGAKCRFDNGLEGILDFLLIEFSRKIN